MKFFVDTANVEAIKKAMELGMCDGVTTNPSLIAKEGKDHEQVIKEIAAVIGDRPLSVEGMGDTAAEMVKDAEKFAKWAPKNVVIKVPMTKEGIKAVRILKGKGIKTNVTLVFSASQALIAAKAGATYVSPFVGRLDDIGQSGIQLIKDIMEIYKAYDHKGETQVIVASVRSPEHVIDSAKVGADVATIPFAVMEKMWVHQLTDKGIELFKIDYAKSQQNK
ncbi:putative transaldolase [Candidatus Gugararchaeum adminiculabundum]|nr:putative transaldolase [Candidatus Gugararchaeum adminiculabundum]